MKARLAIAAMWMMRGSDRWEDVQRVVGRVCRRYVGSGVGGKEQFAGLPRSISLQFRQRSRFASAGGFNDVGAYEALPPVTRFPSKVLI